MKPETLRPSQKIILGLIFVGAGLVRAINLGRLSYWYDEVVTIRLAQTPGPRELIDLLGQIDATRAPLHPLILQGWVKLFGASEASSRSLSVLCGILTVLVVFRLGRLIFQDNATGIWAAFLAAISPLLIVYSRETRMYAWLVLVTCVAWECLFRMRAEDRDPGEPPKPSRFAVPVAFSLSLLALIYSHPLGLLMAGTLAVGSIATRGSLKTIAVSFVAAAVGAAPWWRRYFDHDPESTTGRLPLRYLLGTPIGFLGGNFITLLLFGILIAFGLTTFSQQKPRYRIENPRVCVALLLWLSLPPVVLYLYSMVSHPIFGPARYTLFVAPAFLLLMAHGLARLPLGLSLPAGIGIFLLSVNLWSTLIFAPDLKADWRAAAAYVSREDPAQTTAVHVVAIKPGPNVEVETARYYLNAKRPIQSFDRETTAYDKPVWVAVGHRRDLKTGGLPQPLQSSKDFVDFDGLRLYRITSRSGD